MWSFGCLLAECYIGKPIFMGKTKVDILSKVRHAHYCAVIISLCTCIRKIGRKLTFLLYIRHEYFF